MTYLQIRRDNMDFKFSYSTPTIPILIASATSAEAARDGAILSSGDMASYLLLGAAIGGMLSLIVFKPENWWDALTRWGAAVGMSILFTPAVVRKFFDVIHIDTLVFVSGVIAGLSWLTVRVIRSITVKDIRKYLFHILRIPNSDENEKE